MKLQLKRKIQEKGILELYLISLLAGTVSLKMAQIHYTLQFIATTTLIAVITLLISQISKEKARNSIFIFLSLLISLNHFGKYFLILITYIIIASSLKALDRNKFILSASTAHILDIISTYLVLPAGKELNPVTIKFINHLGVIGGLTINKLLFVGFTSFYALKKFGKNDSKFFFKALILIGASMAARNFLI